MTRRYRIEEHAPNHCTMILRDGAAWEFWAPPEGGYVRRGYGATAPQVCDGLASGGSTLYWCPTWYATLAGQIRREARTGAGSRVINDALGIR